MKKQNQQMKNKATNALLDMGMSTNLKGNRYIIDAMCLFEEDEYYQTGKTTVLYKILATRNNTTGGAVERAIRNAFHTMFDNGNKEVIDKYFTGQNRTNGYLLHTLYFRLTSGQE